MTFFEQGYDQVQLELDKLKLLFKKEEDGDSSEVLVPLAGGICLLKGQLKPQVTIHLGGGMYATLKTRKEAIEILERILMRKKLDWLEYLETENDEEGRIKFETKFKLESPKYVDSDNDKTEIVDKVYYEPEGN